MSTYEATLISKGVAKHTTRRHSEHTPAHARRNFPN